MLHKIITLCQLMIIATLAAHSQVPIQVMESGHITVKVKVDGGRKFVH